MNDRERKLLVVVGILVFAILNLGAFNLVYSPRVKAANDKKKKYEEDLVLAELRESMLDEKQGEIEWLNRNEQKVIKSSQKALADLEALANREAKRRGLTVKRVRPMTALDGAELDRARVEIEVSGREQVLFQWIDRLNSPSELRTATSLRINPKKDDDTQVDCAVILEQWFVPEGRDQAETTT